MLSKEIRHHLRLELLRHPSLSENQVAKVMMLIGGGVMAIYLIIIGSAMGFLADGQSGMLLPVMPMLLAFDFATRAGLQQTPGVFVKPYMLLPIRRSDIVAIYIHSRLLSLYNTTFLFLLLPYAYVSFMGGCTWWETLMTFVAFGLMVLSNALFYLLIRTLTARSQLWWIVPAVVYASFFLIFLLGDEMVEAIFDGVVDFGSTPLFLLVTAAVFFGLYFLTKNVLNKMVYDEVASAKSDDTVRVKSQFTLLDRYGLTGQYLKLELRSVLRCKALRQRLLTSVILTVVLSLLCAFTTMYDSSMMRNFWCFYCFAIFSVTTLAKIMGPEGNYIDLLMVHRESIYQLLRAKYLFHCAVLLLPLLLITPAIVEGKFPLMMVLSYLLLTSGLVLFIMFQLAVNNHQTLPLNDKLTGRNQVESGSQLIVTLVAFFAPIAVVSIFQWLLSETVAYIVISAIGLAFTLTYPLWLHNVYHRMMRRKYDNLDGFHSTL